MNFNEFVGKAVMTALDMPMWRTGQTFFNVLVNVHPELAEKVRGSSRDPFYVDDYNDTRMAKFLEFVEANWE